MCAERMGGRAQQENLQWNINSIILVGAMSFELSPHMIHMSGLTTEIRFVAGL